MEEKQIFHLALSVALIGMFSLYLVSNVFSSVLLTDGPFNVTNVVDGDTLDLSNGERVRLSGINAPESGECGYNEASEALADMVLGKEVYIEGDIDNTGKYGRILRYIYVDDVFVNGLLIEKGYVRVYDKYNYSTKKYDKLKDIEALAKEKGLGVWSCVDPKEGCLYVASKNSKIYHEPHCKWAKKIKEENLICFKSIEETEGYEAAKSC